MRGLGNDGQYWAGLDRGALTLPKCTGCETWHWPAPFRCGTCGSWSFEWADVAIEGEVYSWTRVHHPFGGAEDLGLPYVTVSVALPQAGGIRVFGVLANGHDVHIGQKVSGKVRSTRAFDRDIPALEWRATS